METIELQRIGEPLLRFDGEKIAAVANQHHAIAVYAVKCVEQGRHGIKHDRARKIRKAGYAVEIQYMGPPPISFAKIFARRDSCEQWIMDHRPATYIGGLVAVVDAYQDLVDDLWDEWPVE